jgi:hypothetical protein
MNIKKAAEIVINLASSQADDEESREALDILKDFFTYHLN